MRTATLLAIIAVATAILPGCWDNLDLERRALVLGSFIDPAPDSEERQEGEQVAVTMEMPVLRLMVARGGEGGGGEGTAKELPTWQLTLTGPTVDDAINKANNRSERRLFWGHQKVIVIGEELARRQKLSELVNFWVRHPEGSLITNVFISAGPARELLAARPKFARSVSMFLYEQSERQLRTSRFAKRNLADLLAAILAGRDTLVSRVAPVQGHDGPELQVSGAGIIKDGKLAGWLDGDETRTVVWVTGEFKGSDTLALPVPELARVLSLRLTKVKSEVRPQFAGEQLSMAVSLEIEADITEDEGPASPLQAGMLHQIESQAGAVIKQQVQQTITRLQREYQADVLGFGRKIEQKYPRRWDSLKDNWRQVFTLMPVSVEVKVRIRHTGAVS